MSLVPGWYSAAVRPRASFKTCWTHPKFTLNSYPIVLSPFYCFLVASLILFFFLQNTLLPPALVLRQEPLGELFNQEEIWDARTPLPPWRHPALYFSDRERSTEVAACISSISVRQQYNRAEERHVKRESKWLKPKKKKKKEEQMKRWQLLLSLWFCGKVNTWPRYIHNIDPDVEIDVISER